MCQSGRCLALTHIKSARLTPQEFQRPNLLGHGSGPTLSVMAVAQPPTTLPRRDGSQPCQGHAHRRRRRTGACAVAGADRADVRSTSGQPRDGDRAAGRLAKPQNDGTGGRSTQGHFKGFCAGGFVASDSSTPVRCGGCDIQADTGAGTVWRSGVHGGCTGNTHGCLA